MSAVELRDGILVVAAPRPHDDNPDTWVRTAWRSEAAGELIEGGEIPAGLNETEWLILRRHVYLNEGFVTIARSFSEPASRIRGFAEDATRRFLPDQSLVSEAARIGGVADSSASRAHANIMIQAGRFYRVLGMPLGDTPEGQARFFQWLTENAAMIQSIQDALGDNPIMTDRPEDAREVITVGPDGIES